MSAKAIIKTGYTCNNNCIFCHAKRKIKYCDLSLDAIKDRLLELKKMHINFVIFSGGEPTIRPDIFDITELSKNEGFSFGLITNGRMLRYEQFLNKLLHFGLKYVYISLDGATANTHNTITRSQSFDQTIDGIINVSKKNIESIVNVVVNKRNINELNKIVHLAKKNKFKRLKFSLVEPTGKNYSEFTPDLFTAADKVKEALEYCKKIGLNVGVDGFPLCLIKGYEQLVDNLNTNNIKFIREVYDNKFFPSDEGNKIKIKECLNCHNYDVCEGIYEKYIETTNKAELIHIIQNGFISSEP